MLYAAKHHVSLDHEPELLCWTRMQSEGGQKLEDIVARKELERRAGDGVFFWGVGNAPAVATSTYARLGIPVPVIFSVMKGRPKAVDASPRSLLVWRRYLDMYGAERELPPQALITSRGETGAGDKKRHYALMCRSLTPLKLSKGVRFDPAAFRNVGVNRGPVGASQVTALIQRIQPDGVGDYEANISAELTGSYWIRLTDPVMLDASSIESVEHSIEDASPREWLRLVADFRQRPQLPRSAYPVQSSLL
ncbi:hypothetical protein MesoLjLc_71800 [Mesorhizobium sp. L-8-10]|uniref:hypothetical protein n=1 Tax=Mesorhizobium sp. L-8-10 TaxID=2744523 RepID=UPI0019269062|nr:hypothetical protein [Mesorhizobium sp. L-8-10]BCH35250.1 hypothetical protein MesoLjLc_71800 [Mesorhizobium sp. L-8-10]